MTAHGYRELVGLRPRHPLWAADLIQAHSERLHARLVAEPRLRAAMAKGHALARHGELQREATSRLAQRPTSLERERQLAAAGARLGNGRAAAFRRRRELRALALGFADLAAYYEHRYCGDRRRLDELAAELGCAESAVRGDLRRLGIGRDRTRSHGRARDGRIDIRGMGSTERVPRPRGAGLCGLASGPSSQRFATQVSRTRK